MCSSARKIPERPPDYDLYGTGYWNEGERLVSPPTPKYANVEESKEEWKHVERIFPQGMVPEPPKHDKYPTPSGWMPQTGLYLIYIVTEYTMYNTSCKVATFFSLMPPSKQSIAS